MGSNYPQTSPIYASYGLNETVLFPSPTTIPHKAPLLVNHHSKYSLEASTVPQLLFRNANAYPFRVDTGRSRWRGRTSATAMAEEQYQYYNSSYSDQVPAEVLLPALHEATSTVESEELARQGNSLAVRDWGNDRHVVLHASGAALQQLSLSLVNEDTMTCQSRNTFETGTAIRQIELLGHDRFVIVRGAAMGLVFSMEERYDQLFPEKRETIRFPTLLNHLATSPHVDCEAAFVTTNGSLSMWCPETDVLHYGGCHLYRCEYGSHPCVLWTSTMRQVKTVDIRADPTEQAPVFEDFHVGSLDQLQDATIFDIRRNPSNSHQLLVHSDVALEMIDDRWPAASVFGWSHDTTIDSADFGGPMAVLSSESEHREQVVVLTGSQKLKLTKVRGCVSESCDVAYSLKPMLSPEDEETPRVRGRSTMGIPLEMLLPDASSQVFMFGVAALERTTDSNWGAYVYHSSSIGDIFWQKIQHATDTDESRVHSRLPCGMTVNLDSNTAGSLTLPIESDAFIEEQDLKTIGGFKQLDVTKLLSTAIDKETLKEQDDFDVETFLLEECAGSASVCQVYMKFKAHVTMNLQEFVAYLKTLDKIELQIATASCPATSLRYQPRTPVDEDRCNCVLNHTVEVPCASSCCIVPHQVIVSAVNYKLPDVEVPEIHSMAELIRELEEELNF